MGSKLSLMCWLWLGLCGLLLVPNPLAALELTVRSDTLVRGFERDTAAQTGAAVVPIYEYLQIDAENPGEPGLAFHFYGWGRWDLADNDYFEEETAGELLYGYLEYRHELARFNARLGRQSVYEGVANEIIDGLRLSSDLGRYFSASVYAGQSAAFTEDNGRDGDSIFGGRLAHRLAGKYDLGVSYKKIRSDGDDAEERTGVDLSLYLPAGVNLFGFSAYNNETGDWAEHSYEVNFSVAGVAIRPYVQLFNYEDYFGTGVTTPNPFRFLAGTGEELTVVGGDLIVPVGERWVLVGKAKNYDYQVLDDNSQFYSLQATWRKEGLSQIGGEFGFMNGEVAQNDYALVRLFSYWDQLPEGCPVEFVSGDLVFVGYDQPINNEDRSLFVSLGFGKRFLSDALQLKLSGDYSSDPFFDNDLRGMLTASYQFGRTL